MGRNSYAPKHVRLGLSEDRCPVIPTLRPLRANFKEFCKENLSHVKAFHAQGCTPARPPTQLFSELYSTAFYFHKAWSL